MMSLPIVTKFMVKILKLHNAHALPHIGVSQNRRRLLDFDGRWGKLGLGKKIKDDPMGRGGVPPLSLVGAILSIF